MHRIARIPGICAFLIVMANAETICSPPDSPTRQQRVEAAIASGTRFLLSTISETGMVKNEYAPDTHLHGGRTGLVTYALMAANVPVRTPQLDAALKWLLEAELEGTYAVALRACALGEWNDPRALSALQRDANWLVSAVGDDGSYTYTSRKTDVDRPSDNSNTQMALLGLWAAARRGVNVPKDFWKLAESHWINTQQRDGGWNYRTGSRRSSYGSMTAAGLASLFITFDAIHREDFINVRADTDYEPITRALKWMEENFAADRNPGHSQWWYYWLYSLERVGAASGYKYFAEHDWYAECAERLLELQRDEGYWGTHKTPHETAFAVLFLVRGRYSVLMNKLRYRGKWNSRPRDAANLTQWISWTFERPVSWQVVDIDAPEKDWGDAPILYVSGAGACEFSDKQIERLRKFVLQGGLIISEAAANSGDFTLDMQKHYRRMFPRLRMNRIAEDHPIYALQYKPTQIRGISVISNGIRPLVIHSPRQVSLGLQLGYPGATPQNRASFELLANVYLLGTDKGILLPRGETYWAQQRPFTPSRTITVTPVRYEGNWNPEPLALRRLSIEMANRHQIKLEVAEPVDVAKMDAAAHLVAIMTGTEAFTLDEAQVAALREYFRSGGTLILDAAGGSREFAESAREQILALPDDAAGGPIPREHPVYHSPHEVSRANYRREFALALGPGRHEPRLRGVRSGQRIAIFYSRDDLTGGLVGYQLSGLRGYTPQTARALMTNIICHAAPPPSAPGKQAGPTSPPPEDTN